MTQMICPLSLIGNSGERVITCQEFHCHFGVLFPGGHEECMYVALVHHKNAYYAKKANPFRFWNYARKHRDKAKQDVEGVTQI